MNRRRFLAALAAVPFVGKALVAVEPAHPWDADWNNLKDLQTESVHGLHGNLNATWRRIQGDMRRAADMQFSEFDDIEWELT